MLARSAFAYTATGSSTSRALKFVTGDEKPTKVGDEKAPTCMAVSAKMPRSQPWISVSPFRRVKGSLRRAAPALDPAPRRQIPCPLFWRRQIVSDLRSHSHPYTFNSHSTVSANVTGDFCAACEEVVLDEDKSAHISPAMLDFSRQAVKVEVKA